LAISRINAQEGGINANSATSISRAFGTNVTAGSLIWVTVKKYHESADVFAPADCTKSAGTATLGPISLDVQFQMETDTGVAWASVGHYSAIVVEGGSCTMQVAGAPANSFLLMASGEATGNWGPDRVESTSTGGSATDSTTTATTNSASSAGPALFVASFQLNATVGTAQTHDAAFDLVYKNESGTDDNGLTCVRLVSGATTDAADFTMGSTNIGWAAGLVVYREIITPLVIVPPVWPIRVNASARYLEDSNGVPIFMHGDTCWDLSHNLTLSEAQTFLNDRWARQFNTLVYYPVSTWDQSGNPLYPENLADRQAEVPFTGTNLTTPNEDYWLHVDAVVNAARDLGFILLFWPAYLGFNDEHGIRTLLAAHTTGECEDFGEFLGTRYGGLGNIIWVHGGDINPTTWISKVTAIQDGINNTDADAIHATHWDSGDDPLDYSGIFPESRMDLYATYTYPGYLGVHPTIGAMAYDHYTYPVTKPVFLIETDYENDFRFQTVDFIRRQPYRALLSGACGHVMGNNPIWFGGTDWASNLSTPLCTSIRHVKTLIDGRRWWELVPSRDGTMLASGHGDPDTDTGVQAAVNPSRSLAMGFYPSQLSVTWNMFAMSKASEKVKATWFDTSNGQVTFLGVFGSSGTRVFTPPTAAGPFVLILESETFARRMSMSQRKG
jgi:hypothetical protein